MKWTPRIGRVVDTEGRPIPGALVSVAWGTGPAPEIAVETDRDGRFRLHLPEGLYRLAAHTGSGASGECETEGEGQEEMRIEVTADGREAGGSGSSPAAEEET